MVILEIREPLTINQIMDFQNFIALYNPDERNNCRSRQQMTDRAFFWHNGLQKLTKPRHTESKPKPHNSKPNSFILTSVPNPESQGALGVLKDGIWFQQRTKGLQLRAAGNLFTHGTRPASSSTSHFLGNWHLWLRLCEVAPSKSWPPPPNNICLRAAPGGRLWGVGGGWKAVQGTWAPIRGNDDVEQHQLLFVSFQMPKHIDTQLHMTWRGGQLLRVCCSRWNSSVQRGKEREKYYAWIERKSYIL